MKYYSNEIVFRGHPDKVCDQISDAILDECLRQDKHARCGIETVGGKGVIFVTGEVTTTATINVEQIVKRVLRDVGYDDNYQVIDNLGKQSADIALGTNEEVAGAGDNGMMFGYACNDNDKLLPTAMVILQELSRAYDELRKKDHRFLPDGKAQITGCYMSSKEIFKNDPDNWDVNLPEENLIGIKDFTICYQNTEEDRDATDKIIIDLATSICNKYNIRVERFLINPTGKFLIGGFEGDAGLTGRKIVVDSYQSFAKVGGGAFSGKDPSKVDRSGAYKAREMAKELLQKHGLSWCQVQLSYAIGVDRPLAIYVTSNRGDLEVEKAYYEQCKPKNIIKDLGLLDTCYEDKAKFGHFE